MRVYEIGFTNAQISRIEKGAVWFVRLGQRTDEGYTPDPGVVTVNWDNVCIVREMEVEDAEVDDE